MSFFGSTTFAKPKSRKQPKPKSTKWVDLQPRERSTPGLAKVGKKTEFWLFCAAIVNEYLLKIEQPKRCEIQSEFCDNYHLTPAHTLRRSVIRTDDWFHALRIAVACTECHAWADQRERDESEAIIEGVIQNRHRELGLSEADVKKILLLCAEKVQEENPKWQHFEVVL